MRSIVEIFRRGWRRLSGRGKRALIFYFVGLVSTTGLDGVALVLISSLLKERNETAGDIPTGHIALIAGLVVGLFLLRSAVSVVILWIASNRVAMEELRVGSENFEAYCLQHWEAAQRMKVSDLYTAVVWGPQALSGTLFHVAALVAETVSALVIFGVLVVIQPITAIAAAVFFVLVAILQHQLLSVSAHRAGRVASARINSVYEILSDSFSLKKVLLVSPSLSLSKVLTGQRRELASARAKLRFVEPLPRFLMEATLAVGVAVIGLVTYLTQGKDLVVPALAVFAAAGFRLLPTVNSIQGTILSIAGRVPLSVAALDYLDNASARRDVAPTLTSFTGDDQDVVLALDKVSYRYPDGDSDSLVEASIQFRRGLQYAIVGPSGSGKTTLVELCLGLREPTGGSVRLEIAGPVRGYVPQDTHIAGIPVFNNVALEWDDSKVDVLRAEQALSMAELTVALQGRNLAESVQGMSGGQLQRLGLARALYRAPGFLVLDEATNALDATTEASVIESLELLRGKITVLLVAHRLSTVRHADQVIYVEGGRVVHIGPFVDVYNSVPAFAQQVDLGRFDVD